MSISRRAFLGRTAASIAAARALTVVGADQSSPPSRAEELPLVVSTWPFGRFANEAALRVLKNGGSLLDAVEQGIWVPESDPSNSSVGLHGTPNAAGVPQLDACIMFGPGHKAGSVAGLEGIRHPISVARLVMEKTRHVMLVGEGARIFALEHGLESVETKSAELYDKYLKQKQAARAKSGPKPANNHDTIALLVLGVDGTIAGGCSTSGLGGKLPGRVGDSPIIGSGLYVDNEVGAAGATGIGENVMRYCGSLLIVEQMRQGLHPLEACRQVIRRIVRSENNRTDLSINFVALDKHGRYGAAGTDGGFQYAVATPGSSRVLPNPGLG
jgi:N4-(beta-N-acetylglucosaminyl)-L-asparaginase